MFLWNNRRFARLSAISQWIWWTVNILVRGQWRTDVCRISPLLILSNVVRPQSYSLETNFGPYLSSKLNSYSSCNWIIIYLQWVMSSIQSRTHLFYPCRNWNEEFIIINWQIIVRTSFYFADAADITELISFRDPLIVFRNTYCDSSTSRLLQWDMRSPNPNSANVPLLSDDIYRSRNVTSIVTATVQISTEGRQPDTGTKA